jgi:RNase adaptor protein for sRNA GlmZ degradation
MFAVIITGAPGAGKSSALTALSDLLGDDEIPHVTIELDDLARGWPWRYPPAAYEGLAAFMSVQRTELLVAAATITSREDLARLLTAAGCDAHLLVRLHAQPDTLRRRIRARETIPWSGLEALVDRAETLQERMAALEGVHLALDSESATPQALAQTIRSASSRARSTRSPTSDFD